MLCVERVFEVFTHFGSGFLPAMSAATLLRWFGMMTKKTLPVIIVAISAPVWMSAPRPEKKSVKTQLVSTT